MKHVLQFRFSKRLCVQIKILKHVLNILGEYFIKEWYKNYSICPFENTSKNLWRVFESWFLKENKLRSNM